MNTKKIKTIIIIILLLVDIAFGALLITDKTAERRHASRTLADLSEVMEKNGVAFLPESIPENPSLCVLKCGRDLSAEAAIAASLIGECSAQDLGGGLYVYENANGSARFRSNGEFEAVLSDRRGAAQQDIVSDAAFLRRARREHYGGRHGYFRLQCHSYLFLRPSFLCFRHAPDGLPAVPHGRSSHKRAHGARPIPFSHELGRVYLHADRSHGYLLFHVRFHLGALHAPARVADIHGRRHVLYKRRERSPRLRIKSCIFFFYFCSMRGIIY